MIWKIRVAKTAEKQLRRIPKKDIDRIIDAVDNMEADPFSGDIIKLGGEDHVWRRRIGNYRIKYKILMNERIVDIYDIDRRTSSTY